MKQIISASRRTDIPAFHADWFMDRIREGYCHVPNPMYPLKKTLPINLKPEDVDIIVFWTRDPSPLMKYLPELEERGYKYYFQYTIIGYPEDIDPRSPAIKYAIETFKELSSVIGKEKVIWRYDPILFSNITPKEWHAEQISKISEELEGYTERLVISFIDKYRKIVLRLGREGRAGFKLHPGAFDAVSYRSLAEWIGGEMKKKGIRVMTCAEKIDLKESGIEHGKCIDNELIGGILGHKVTDKKDMSQREDCCCVRSRDIGTNNTCSFGCKYCYATASKNLSQIDKEALML